MPTDKSTPTDLTPEDWAAAGELADLLGVPSEQLVRDFLEELDRLTPEERAEFERVAGKANKVLPNMHASLDRIGKEISSCVLKVREMRAQMSAMSKRVSSIEVAMGIAEPR